MCSWGRWVGRESSHPYSSRGGWKGGRGAREESGCGQWFPTPPHASTQPQSGPGKETGNRRGRQPLFTALTLRHSGLLPQRFKTEATGEAESRQASCQHTGPGSLPLPTGPIPHSLCTLGLQPRASPPGTAKRFLWQQCAPLQKPALQRVLAGPCIIQGLGISALSLWDSPRPS